MGGLKGKAVNLYGKSAYEIAVIHGFKGTEKEWLDSLKCSNCEGSGGSSTPEVNVDLSEVNEQLSQKLEGFSSKYNITQKGWHRVLNTIRGNGGTLSLTLADTLQLQTITIDMSGFVRWRDSGASQVPDFMQTSYKHLKPNLVYSDDYFLHKISKVRIGYPSQEALKTEFEEVDAGNPINCYVDIYVDFQRPVSIAFTSQFTGKSNQHNCYNITAETIDSNYKALVAAYWDSKEDFKPDGTPDDLSQGMYGEDLEFYSFTVNPSFDEYAPNKIVMNKRFYADDYFIKGDTSYKDINTPHCIGKYPIRVHTWMPNHEVTSDSNCDFRFVRKYNWLNLHVPMTTNEKGELVYTYYDHSYGDDTVNGKQQTTHRVIVPNKCSKKTFQGIYYNITNSGAFIFSGKNTENSTKYMDIFCATTKEDAIFLPAGNYLVGGLHSIGWQETADSDFSNIDTATMKTIGHHIGQEDGKRKTIITFANDCYLVRARMRTTASFDSGNDCVVEIPFMVKLPPNAPTDNVDIIDYSFKGATDHKIVGLNYNASNDGEGRFVYTGADDKIIITDNTDSTNTVVSTIDLWTDFYSSEYAKGVKIPHESPLLDHENFDTGLQELAEDPVNWQSQRWERIGTYTPIVDVYRMYNDSDCVNYYDTLLMPLSNGMIENTDYKSIRELLLK